MLLLRTVILSVTAHVRERNSIEDVTNILVAIPVINWRSTSKQYNGF